MDDWEKTVPLNMCPAVECSSRFPPRRITLKGFSELHEALEKVADGTPYDYYHCLGQCNRIWRIERHDRVRGEPYQAPEWKLG
jgi:hypothetical protein